MEMAQDFRRLFDPRHIAVIGASPNHVHGRYDYIDWHIRAGFAGTLYPVNPRYSEVKGLKCYPALKDIPGEVDIVISMIPAEATVELLRASAVPYELRTTVVPGLLDENDLARLGEWLGGSHRYFLQQFRPGKCLDPLFSDLPAHPPDYLKEQAAVLSAFFAECSVRGLG